MTYLNRASEPREEISVIIAHRPVSLVRIRQLRKIERRRLLDELDITRARNLVVEAQQHRIRQIHAAQRNLKHTTRAQYLRL